MHDYRDHEEQYKKPWFEKSCGTVRLNNKKSRSRITYIYFMFSEWGLWNWKFVRQ
jgi:hypothetical protein